MFVSLLRNSLAHDQIDRNLEVALEAANIKPLINGASLPAEQGGEILLSWLNSQLGGAEIQLKWKIFLVLS